jgi:RNA polymerase sigma-70 factor (ECF subfamily)
MFRTYPQRITAVGCGYPHLMLQEPPAALQAFRLSWAGKREIPDPGTFALDTLPIVPTPPNTPARKHPRIARFPHDRLSDAELVAAITQGENEALGVIWDRYAVMVRGVLRASLGYDSDVEDLLQEVFIAFLQGAGRLRSADSLRGYLIGVAVRLVMGELRRRRVRRWVTLQPSEELQQAPAPVNHDEDAMAALQALYRLLDGMPARRRMAFVLRYVEGLEVIEAARVMDVSESTIKREARKARQALALRAERSEPRLWAYMQTLQENESDASEADLT